MFFLFLQTKVRSKLLYCHIWTIFNNIEIDGKEITKFLYMYILIETYYFALGENHKFGNTFLQRFIMVNIDILCPLESHAFEIIPVTLSLVKHAYKEVPGKGDFTS